MNENVLIFIGSELNFQNLDEAVCIPHSASTLGKGMNPTVLPQAMSK